MASSTLNPDPYFRYTSEPTDSESYQEALEIASDYHQGKTWPEDWELEMGLIQHHMERFERRWGMRLRLLTHYNDLFARCSF